MVTVKRLYVMLGMLLCACIAGCAGSPTDTDGKQDTTATPADAASSEQEDGQNVTEEETTEDMTLLRDYTAVDNKKYSWYIVRDKNHGISDCDHSFSIEQYDAYYADLDAGDDKVMYLTFDCGYENGYTEQILDTLKKHDAKACFFVTQTFIRDNVELVKRMKEEGHQVGNHTVTHPSMPEITVEKQKEELKTCAEYMKEVTGCEMDPYCPE